MGRKIILKVLRFCLFLLPLFGVSGCADFEFHVREDTGVINPRVILLAPIENRNMNYDPYVSDEFRDAVQFEFFRRGYNAVTVRKSDAAVVNDSEWAAKTCIENSGDILIKGVISQRESGFLTDRETATLITFTVYGKNGSVLGEGYYHDNRPAGEEPLRRKAAELFVSELIKKTGQVK